MTRVSRPLWEEPDESRCAALPSPQSPREMFLGSSRRSRLSLIGACLSQQGRPLWSNPSRLCGFHSGRYIE